MTVTHGPSEEELTRSQKENRTVEFWFEDQKERTREVEGIITDVRMPFCLDRYSVNLTFQPSEGGGPLTFGYHTTRQKGGPLFPLRHTVEIGADFCRNGMNFYEQILANERMGINADEVEMLQRPEFTATVASRPAILDLIVIPPAALGFKEGDLRDHETLFAKAMEFDFYPCPAEIAPRLQAQNLGQPTGQILHIAMEPICNKIFILVKERGPEGHKLWLSSIPPQGVRLRKISPDTLYVFHDRKRSTTDRSKVLVD